MKRTAGCACLLLLLAVAATPAAADLSAFVATVGFDDDASLERGMGIGLRWGKSSGIIGGETSLLVARPDRKLSVGGDAQTEAATALFYEGRLLVNIPVGQVKPFVGVGFGAVTITSTDVAVPAGADEAVGRALQAVADLQTHSAISYGAGVRYGLNDRLDLRLDLRQYLVFSVKGLALREIESQTGAALPDELADDNTVQYNELSVGVSVRF